MPLGRSETDDLVLLVDLPGSKPTGGLIAALAASKPNCYDGPPPSIGLVTMTKHPPCFETWLTYHYERCGIRKFYVRVEDTPELASLLQNPPWDKLVEVEFASGPRDYFTQMDRQSFHIERVLPRARAEGLEFLLHIDDDELLYCPAGLPSLHAALARAPLGAGDLHMQNLEAYVPGTDCVNPFEECTAFKHRTDRFCAYSNGKAFGRLRCTELSPAGPHHYRLGLNAPGSSGTHEIPPTTAVVLHYESATYPAWRKKYLDLAHRHAGSDQVRHRAPSSFYHESMVAMAAVDAAQRLGAAAEAASTGGALATAESAAISVYREWKLQPSVLPPKPTPASPQPRLDIEAGATMINVMAQPRVARVGEAELQRSGLERLGRSDGGERASQQEQQQWRPMEAAAVDVSDVKPSDEARCLRSFYERCTGPHDSSPEAELEELVTSIAGIEAGHLATLRGAGATARALLGSTKPEFDALTKGAGLSLGVRLKLRGAINKVLAACSTSGH